MSQSGVSSPVSVMSHQPHPHGHHPPAATTPLQSLQSLPSATHQQQQPALPPSKAEVERKLSFKLPPGPRPVPVRKHSKNQQIGSGNESDSSSIASSSLPALITTNIPSFATHLATSPVASPATPHVPPHAPLSAIAERQGSSIDIDEINTTVLDPEGLDYDDGEGSEEEEADNAQLGMDGERVFRSGFLFKKQERRKVWKKKWFVLRSTKLAYYKDNREYSLSRAIELRQIHSCVAVTSEKQKHPFALAIVTADRTFFAEALSADERDEWVRSINSAMRRMSEREDEEARRREKADQRAIAVPAPSPRTEQHPHEVETHPGTWTSQFSMTTGMSGMSVSPAASASGSFQFRSATAPPSSFQPPPSSSFQLQPPPVGQHGQQGRPQSPSAAAVSQQLANTTLNNSGSSAGPAAAAAAVAAGAPPPSAAMVNRRLSNPIPIPGFQVVSARSTRRDPSISSVDRRPSTTPTVAGGGAGAGAAAAAAASGAGASLATPQGGTQFVSSDEDEAYFSDPHAAWPDLALEPPLTATSPMVADPNKIILAMYLMKKSRKTAREVWRKRWFFLTSGGVTYTKSHMDNRPLRFIPMSTILDVFSVDTDDDDDDGDTSDTDAAKYAPQPARHTSLRSKLDGASSSKHRSVEDHVVRIVTNKRRYDLCAPSEEEEIKWIAAIRALINREREQRERARAAAQQPPLSPRSESKPPLMASHVPTIVQQPPTPAVHPAHRQAQATGAPPPGVPVATAPGAPSVGPVPGSSGAPPLSGPPSGPTHTRTRSATQTAKSAVADVVRKFHDGG